MSDIVARLRVINHHTKKLAENEGLHSVHREAFTRCEALTGEAAMEIERLNACVAEANAYMAEAALAIDRLTAERDELRCEVCDWVGNHFKEPPQDVAKRNGWNCFDTGVWDCYKEETK